MAMLPKQIIIKESLSELKAIKRKSGNLISKRIRVLIEFKRHEKTGISKREVSARTGVNHNSVTKWHNKYLAKGIQGVLTHGRIGFKKSLIYRHLIKPWRRNYETPKLVFEVTRSYKSGFQTN